MKNVSEKTSLPISHHIFLFPFKWDYYTNAHSHDTASFLERTKLSDIESLMKDKDLSKFWGKFEFKFKVDQKDQYNNYNEYAYFHDFVRSTMAIKKDGEIGSHQYSYKIDENPVLNDDEVVKPTYKITVVKEGKVLLFELSLEQIIMNFYDVGVGFISFHLENYKYKEPSDILKINDYGRRLYPPFLGVEDKFASPPRVYTSDPKEYDSLPDRIELAGIKPIQREGLICEDFTHFNIPANIIGEPNRLPEYITKLLTNVFVTNKSNVDKNFIKHVVLQPIVDDRMFVMSYFINNTMMVKQKVYDENEKTYSYSTNDFWYKYLFVDNSAPSIASINMKKELLHKHTYDRWVNKFGKSKDDPEAVLFGMSRYSFVLLADDSFFSQNILPNHFRYLYFQMIALALVQRAAILRFSGEASNIVSLLKESKKRRTSQLISELYLEYIYFVNKIHHREISPQEQGIELYNMLQDIMAIDTNVKHLDQEIEELNSYAKMIEYAKKSEEAERLTRIATLFLPPTLVAGIFGFSNLSGKDHISFGWAFAILVLVFLCSLGWLIISSKKNK